MKFSCEKNLLVSAISVASRTVAMKSAIPALEGIYIRAGVKVMLSGYNLETGITVGVDAEIRETGEAIFPSRLFFDIVRKLPDDTVEVSVDENFKVSIRGGISSFSITAMSAEDYPELPDVESEKGVVLPQKQLKEMISGTIFAVSENQARPIHTGCLFEVADDGITVIAVDGYRLALRRWTPEGGVGRQMKFVAPAAALKEVEKILTDSDDDCTFYLGTKHILFTIGEATLVPHPRGRVPRLAARAPGEQPDQAGGERLGHHRLHRARKPRHFGEAEKPGALHVRRPDRRFPHGLDDRHGA